MKFKECPRCGSKNIKPSEDKWDPFYHEDDTICNDCGSLFFEGPEFIEIM